MAAIKDFPGRQLNAALRVAAVAALALAASACSAYRVTVENPYPAKTELYNPYPVIRNVRFSEEWGAAASWRHQSKRIGEMLQTRFPDSPQREGGVYFDVIVHAESPLIESDDAGTTALTQGLFPTEINVSRRETITLRFYNEDGRFLFERQSRTLRITDDEAHSLLGMAWCRTWARDEWHTEAGHVNRRYEILRDTILNILDAPDTREACALAAGTHSGVRMTTEEPVSSGPGPADAGVGE